MRVLIFHGYLLRGTGSNVYNAELAQELARQGHDVHLICQERKAAEIPWVDAVGTWAGGRLAVRETGPRSPGAGRITVYLPEIGGLLPVFVRDAYEGFEVKTFGELTSAELDRYIACNLAAVRDVVARAGAPDAALANHLIMGPVILARAGLRYAVKVHGSDLSYAVLSMPERYGPLAIEGAESATALLVGSSHTAGELWKAVGEERFGPRTRLGPPGLDPAEFAPRRPDEAVEDLRLAAAQLRATGSGAGESSRDPELGGPVAPTSPATGEFGRDPALAAAGLEWFAAGGPRVAYVGKLLINKGVDLLLAAWPLIHRRHPGARLLLAGFGGFRPGLEQLWSCLATGDLAGARAIAAAARESDLAPRRLGLLAGFLDRAGEEYAAAGREAAGSVGVTPGEEYAAAGRDAAGSVRVTGRLVHSEVAPVLAAADLLVMPSSFPEAFGMVAAEAAASGTLPLVARHSGMAEVARGLAEALDPGQRYPAQAPGPEHRDLSASPDPDHRDPIAHSDPPDPDLMSFPLRPAPVEALAAQASDWLGTEDGVRRDIEGAISLHARRKWSWARVAGDILAAADGDLDGLTPPARIVEALE